MQITLNNTKPLERYLRISIFRNSVTEKQNAIKSYQNVFWSFNFSIVLLHHKNLLRNANNTE